jgi:surface antigen
MSRGHVAVVSDILTDRVIRITHANWGGSRGKVEENVTVVDVSDAGDWTAVKVWYNPIHDLGTSVYPTRGFIYKEAPISADGVLMAGAPASVGQP